MSVQKPLAAFRLVDTRRGDSLQAIALRELGDAALWYDLVAINDLVPPFLTDDPLAAGPRVILAGRTIKVPATAPAASGVPPETEVFGTDLALPRGRLAGDGKGDLATLSGPANLAQALSHAIATEPGELRYHPAYGCEVHRLKGAAADQITDRLAAMYVARTVRADPRVARVENMTASVIGDTVRPEGTAVAVDGKRIPVAR